MSHEISDYYQVYQETERRARKGHNCSACAEPIHRWGRPWADLPLHGDIGPPVEPL